MSARTIATEPLITGRQGFAFSSNGRYAASVGIAGDVAMLETWDLTPDEAVRRGDPGLPVDRDTGVLPLDDGSLVLLRESQTSSRRHMISLHDSGADEGFSLGSLTAEGGYLLPAPEGAIAVAIDADHTTLWRVSVSPPGMELLLRLPGVLSGGAWIDQARGQLALNRTPPGGRAHGIVVDLTNGSWRCIWSVSEASSDRILLYAPATRLLVVSSNATGEPRLGCGVLGEGTVHFPEVLHRPGHPRNPLAVDRRGERVLVHEANGAVTQLLVYTPSNQRLTPVSSPRGVITSPACWRGDIIRVPFSSPTRPPGLGTIRLRDASAAPRWSLPATTPSVDAELVELDGAEGPVEAIAYGGPNWQRRERVVLALHGGPMSAWPFGFNPLFQRMASAGFAVVAPNCRGSTGYGPDYMPAKGGWGGPDLDDVRALGNELAQDRAHRGLPAPVVLGVSYGAYLALLAACTDPDVWSGCVALAPFLSPSALHAAAGEGVRHRIQDLGALDGTDSRDVLRRSASLRVPLLLVHGSRDERIPVEQSRTLRRRLAELDRADVDYLELDADHAGVVAQWPTHLLNRIEDFCLTRAARFGAGRRSGNRVRTRLG